MAVEVTLLTADAEGAGGDLVTESISPTGPVLMAAFITQGTIAQNPPISGCGLSWTLCARIADGSNFRALFLWLGTGTPTEGAITVSEDGNEWDSKSWLVAQVGGASESVIVAENLIAALSMDLEFPRAIAAGNGAFAVFSTSNLYALTPREGWTNLLAGAVGVQGAGNISSAWRSDPDTHAGGTFPGGTTLYGIAVELEAAGGAPDTTAPTLSNASAQATGATTATGSVDTDEAGTADAVLTTSATPPTATQIQAGQDHTGAAAAASDLGVAASVGTVNFSFTGLTASTTYYLHAVVEDAATNVSAVATSASFQTDAPTNEAPVVTITSPALASIAVTAGTPLRLTATATDAEDGDLSASIEWTSSNTDDGTGGELGTGASIDVDTTGWSEEARTITATVADAALAEGSDSFVLTIGAAPAPSGGYLKALALVASLGGY